MKMLGQLHIEHLPHLRRPPPPLLLHAAAAAAVNAAAAAAYIFAFLQRDYADARRPVATTEEKMEMLFEKRSTFSFRPVL